MTTTIDDVTAAALAYGQDLTSPLTAQVADLTAQLASANTALAAATADDATDAAAISSLTAQVSAAQVNLSNAQAALAASDVKNASLTATNAQLQAMIDSLKGASSSYTVPTANTILATALPAGKSPSLALGASTKNLILPAGTTTWKDFAEAAGNAAGWFRSAGVFGQGVGVTIIQMAENSGTAVIDKAARGSGVILKHLFRIDGATEFGGLSIIGTAQSKSKFYNGLNVYKGLKGFVHDIYIEGVPGYDSAPPGETIPIHNTTSVGERFARIEANLAGSSSGFGSNHSTDTLLEDSSFYDSTYGAGIAIYKETRGVVRNSRFTGNAKPGINIEQQTGVFTIDSCFFHANSVDIAINANQAYKTGVVEILEPQKPLGEPLSIRIGSGGYVDFEDRSVSSTQGASWANVWVTIAGVRKNAQAWGSSIVTCLS